MTWLGRDIHGMQGPYEFREDSELLAACLGLLGPAESFLEIGVGNAVNLRRFSGRFLLSVGTDIEQRNEMKELKKSKDYEIVIADKASCFRSSVFDVVAFNPPYLPSEGIDDITVDGGAGGIEVPFAFLEDAIRVGRAPHKVVIVLSTDSNVTSFKERCKTIGMRCEVIAQKKLFFETLYGILVSEI